MFGEIQWVKLREIGWVKPGEIGWVKLGEILQNSGFTGNDKVLAPPFDAIKLDLGVLWDHD